MVDLIRLPADIERSATLSNDGAYRYWLARRWNASLPMLVFVMLNPSTADGATDDATIRVCMGRAYRMGCGGIVVVNLFAYRATRPYEMLAAADPVGPENAEYLSKALRLPSRMVVAAWGADGNHRGRAQEFIATARAHERTLHCLGVTKENAPRHPLRISYALDPVVYGFRD